MENALPYFENNKESYKEYREKNKEMYSERNIMKKTKANY
jgi:hypothetical protein